MMPSGGFVANLQAEELSAFVANAVARFEFSGGDGHVHPLIVNDGENIGPGLSSLLTQFCSLPLHTLQGREASFRHLAGIGLYRALTSVLPLSSFSRSINIDDLAGGTITGQDGLRQNAERLTAEIKARFPDHAIVVRGLVPEIDQSLCGEMLSNGYELIVARNVFVLQPDAVTKGQFQHTKRDRALLAKSGLSCRDRGFSGNDFRNMARLYRSLYLERHSHLSPEFTAKYFETADQAGALDFHVLSNSDNEMAGFCTTRSGPTASVMMHVGYDPDRADAFDLYRILHALAVGKLLSLGKPIHMGSGAQRFKRNRGAICVPEYVAVCSKHLSMRRRAGYLAIKGFNNTVVAKGLSRTANAAGMN